ncbi:hypothetical protein BESB_061360 [Besnoitia besnoiti]|uniref:Uncharacterized protein n=1 Tax=Besnoitia besnoiti TaxID=94643 RepID=A0A2A9MBJ3_BESBE|nr:hypothetical protein BESB_061360 [Besnoitia besnoiti]PFH35249.1 hypothetical protein BESB_061360 [Besnoitia besnoiti]
MRRKSDRISSEAVDGHPLCVSSRFCPFYKPPSALRPSSPRVSSPSAAALGGAGASSFATYVYSSEASSASAANAKVRVSAADGVTESEGRVEQNGETVFDEDGKLRGCLCRHLESDPRIKFKTIETIARERGNIHAKSYVFVEEYSPTEAPALPPSRPPAASTRPGISRSGKKAKELRDALRNLPGNKHFICGRDPLRKQGNDNINKWMDKHVAVPMRACDRVAGTPKRTVREELLLALEEGVVHDLISPAEILDSAHHVKRVANWRNTQEDRAGVLGCMWTGPYVGLGETLVAGIYVGEVRHGEAPWSDSEEDDLRTAPDYSFDCGWRDTSMKFLAMEESRKRVRFHERAVAHLRQQKKKKKGPKHFSKPMYKDEDSAGECRAVLLSPYGNRLWKKPFMVISLRRPCRISCFCYASAESHTNAAHVVPHDAEIGVQPDGTVVLPDDQYLCLDSSRYFNLMSLVNDSRDVPGQRRLKANLWIYELHFEGFPFFVFMKRMESDLRHMEECLVNCGAQYRFNHLQPLCEEALSHAVARKPEKDSLSPPLTCFPRCCDRFLVPLRVTALPRKITLAAYSGCRGGDLNIAMIFLTACTKTNALCRPQKAKSYVVSVAALQTIKKNPEKIWESDSDLGA